MDFWMTPVVLVGLVMGIVLIGLYFSARKVASSRARGIYPEAGKEREQDVVRLLSAGEKIMAIRCYRAVHRVGLKEAKDAVEALDTKKV